MADPKGLLQGAGKRIRHVTIRRGEDLEKPDLWQFVRSDIQNARQRAATGQIPETPPQSVVKALYAKKRGATKNCSRLARGIAPASLLRV
jgi:hypothetical protein